MTLSAHLLISWLGTVEILKERRERTLVTLAGFLPDLDGLGVLVDKITGTTELFFKYHHYYGHGILFALAASTVASLIATQQKVTVFILSFLMVHVHILCDVVGSRGPDGYQWPVYYLYPMNLSFSLTWSGQWALNAWQNVLIFAVVVCICLYYAVTKKISFFEVVHPRANQAAMRLLDRFLT